VTRFFTSDVFVRVIPSVSHTSYFPIEGNLFLENPNRESVVLLAGSVLANILGGGVYDSPPDTPWEFYSGGRWRFEYPERDAIGPFRAEIDLPPAIEFEPPPVLSTHVPFVFTWPTAGVTGTQIASVRMELTGRSPDVRFNRNVVTIECRAPAKAGSLTIPTDELQWYSDVLWGPAELTFEVSEPPRRVSAPGLDYGSVRASHRVVRQVEVR
jgi:hypothetical protein